MLGDPLRREGRSGILGIADQWVDGEVEQGGMGGLEDRASVTVQIRSDGIDGAEDWFRGMRLNDSMLVAVDASRGLLGADDTQTEEVGFRQKTLVEVNACDVAWAEEIAHTQQPTDFAG